MNGLARVAGVASVRMNGVEYRIRGKPAAFYADVESRIALKRGDPVAKIIEAAKASRLENNPLILEDVANVIADKFRNWGVATYSDIIDYSNTLDCDALTIWHCIHDDHPEVSLDDVRLYVIRMKFKGLADPVAKQELADVFRAIAVASGEDQLGNSTGQPQKTDGDPSSTGS